ncbi:hypothetical protein [Xanthomonas cucurbitae]|nr:hypothetical protein [Xanthomonas cucurbitae]
MLFALRHVLRLLLRVVVLLHVLVPTALLALQGFLLPRCLR